MKTQDLLQKVLTGKDLKEREAYQLFLALFKQELSSQESKLLLVSLSSKGESPVEVLGCLKALRRLEPAARISVSRLMDTCGTGGDGSQTFNISTVAALVVAGAGGHVAKHGNRALSSRSGSSDLFEALGVKLDAPRKRMIQSVKQHGIGYFHAPFYHPIFSRVQPLRRTLKIRTVFNLLGPLVNPFKLNSQLIGVAKKELVPLFAMLLKKTGMQRALICHSEDGLDELSTTSPATVALVKKNGILFKRVDPKRLGFKKASKKALRGGSAQANSRVALKILQGKKQGPIRDTIVLNAGAALWVSGCAKSLEQGIRKAQESIDNGSAFKALQGLKKVSKKP